MNGNTKTWTGNTVRQEFTEAVSMTITAFLAVNVRPTPEQILERLTHNHQQIPIGMPKPSIKRIVGEYVTCMSKETRRKAERHLECLVRERLGEPLPSRKEEYRDEWVRRHRGFADIVNKEE